VTEQVLVKATIEEMKKAVFKINELETEIKELKRFMDAHGVGTIGTRTVGKELLSLEKQVAKLKADHEDCRWVFVRERPPEVTGKYIVCVERISLPPKIYGDPTYTWQQDTWIAGQWIYWDTVSTKVICWKKIVLPKL